MKLGIIGTGYAGLVAGTCFAESGNDVICMDNDSVLIESLKSGVSTIYEPLLDELLKKNLRESRIRFTTSLSEVARHSEIVFICLPARQNDEDSSDISLILDVLKDFLKWVNENKLVVVKSTIPSGSGEKIKSILKSCTEYKISYAYNPEFLKEGNAVSDFMSPDRIIIGSSSGRAADKLKELYSAFMRTSNRIIIMDERSAELSKYATNAMLASRISFMNEIALLCEKTGANIDSVRAGIGSDSRIGERYLFAGVGYGGSCFANDLKSLIKTGDENQVDFKLLKAVEEINERQIAILLQKIKRHFGEKLIGRKFAVWGLSFKPKTDDIRESPAVEIAKRILKDGAMLNLTDPVAIEKTKSVLKRRSGKIKFFENYYDSLKDTDALIVLTEWNEFRKPDFDKMKSLMKTPVIFDGRNIYNPRLLKEKKFVYYGIGR